MKIDFEKNNTYNCDFARPYSIDLDWLEKNPGQLFNNDRTVREREMMLHNERNSSCEFNCFRVEDAGAISPRIIRKGYVRSHDQVITTPRILDITLGSDCNLTCTYCLKEYSSAWRHDLQTNGNYPVVLDDDRYQLNIADKAVNKLSQNKKLQSRTFQLILKELDIVSSELNTIYITGGEPFLHNNLFDILEKVKNVPNVFIFSGLGVNVNRIEKILTRLKEFKNVQLWLSFENIGRYLEFNRYGNRWEDYQKKINLVMQSKINFLFHSVLSNLSLFGFQDFLKIYREHALSYDFVHKPDFMSLYVLDDESKNYIKDIFSNDPLPWKEQLFQTLEINPSDAQILNLKIFLKEFSRRRNINVAEVFPKSFVDWIS